MKLIYLKEKEEVASIAKVRHASKELEGENSESEENLVENQEEIKNVPELTEGQPDEE